MLNGLLNQDKSILSQLTDISRNEIKSENGVKEEVTLVKEDVKPKEEETATVIVDQAWVESDECTSCKDCIEALPAVFKYDANKQAFVHNPKGGTFAQIVQVAEKCPARCIHPGIPQNQNEKSLEKWIKRAEKFN